MEQYIKPAIWVIATPDNLMETTLPKASPQPGGGEDPFTAEGKETTIFEEVELPAQENIWGDEE